MLGRRARVKVLCKVGKCIYKAHISSSAADTNKTVYLLSRRTPRKELSCVAAALAEVAGQDEKIIFFSLPGEIYYEPEIRDKIKSIPLFEDLVSLHCLYEKSCGGIVFTEHDGELKLLLVKNINGRFWSFPKGHVEKGETEKETAKREILEETGLDVNILSNFRETSDYTPFGRVKKRVVFFLAKADNEDVTIQPSEIDGYIWVSFDEAKRLCGYENDLRVLKKARSFLSKSLSTALRW